LQIREVSIPVRKALEPLRLTEVDREKIFAGNLPRVYPRFKRVQPAPPAFRTTP
jgi:hypothetical protein